MNNHKIDRLSLLRSNHPELTVDWVEDIASTQFAVKPNALLIAEHQHAGVGRRGNHWLTPKGQSICFSYRFNLALSIEMMSGYALSVALAVIQTMLKYDPITQAKLKWPNDLYIFDKKFAGILIGLTPKEQNAIDVTIGIGINWTLSDEQLNSVDQAVANIPLTNKPKRVGFIDQLISQIKNNTQQFKVDGIKNMLSVWQRHDYLEDKNITLKHGQNTLYGRYLGIDKSGQLKAKINDQVKTFAAAEVSVRSTDVDV